MNMYAIGRAMKWCLPVLAVWMSVLATEPALAQTANFPHGAPKLPAWPQLPDWNGIWERGGDIVWDDSLPYTPGEPQAPPYNQQYMQEYEARRAKMRAENLAGHARNPPRRRPIRHHAGHDDHALPNGYPDQIHGK